jgi:penicillin-binding protein 1C
MHAPHLALRLAGDTTSARRVASTIDGQLERLLEPIVTGYRSHIDPPANLALLAVRNADAAVVAHFGSSEIADPDRSGDIDFTRAVRSPGSALKPFVYGMAFETLLIHPDTIMVDAPAHYGDYTPTNFDGEYTGLTTVRDALRQSLNTTAVAVLDALGPPKLASRLRSIGVPLHLPGPDSDATPALAVGGCGINLEGLVTLYTGLASRGVVRPLRFRLADAVDPGKVLLRPDAAWAIADILASARRPGGTSADQIEQPRRVAFKTGTSAGYRDSWAVGFTADYTVGVWIGRADAASMPGQYGRIAAAPLMFRVFDQLPGSFTDPGGPAPVGSPLLPRTDLPPRLARFEPSAAFSDTPVIDAPVPGAEIVAPRSGIVLRGHGGHAPWRWLADGQQIAPASSRIETVWLPRNNGQVGIELIDGDGQSASASFWVDITARSDQGSAAQER